MMNQVEALCDRILLINRGQAVLYGPLAEIKRRYAPNTVRLRSPQPPGSLPGIVKVEEHDRVYELYPAEGTTSQMILQTLVERGVPVESFEVATAPMEQVFIAVVGGEKS
jgi:ABC-2 type transport system ATP-binding protein